MQLPIELELLIYKHSFNQNFIQLCKEITALVELAVDQTGDQCLYLPLRRRGWGWKRKIIHDFVFTPAYWGHYDPTVCACSGLYRGVKLSYKNSTYHYSKVACSTAQYPEVATEDNFH